MTASRGKDAGPAYAQDKQEEPKLRTYAGRNYADLQQQLLSSRATAEVTSSVEWYTSGIQCNSVDCAFLAVINSHTQGSIEMHQCVPDCRDSFACAVDSL